MIGVKRVERDIKEYGDYQTPEIFVEKVCQYLRTEIANVDVIIEPTCGLGNFIVQGAYSFKDVKKIFGIDINKSYCNNAKKRVKELGRDDKYIKIFKSSIFTFDFRKIKKQVRKDEKILIIGNPPWVTNSTLTLLDSDNLPVKDNFKGLKGYDAITGKGDFDIAESIILRMLTEFQDYTGYLAMLCKNVVAKNIVRDLINYDLKISEMKMFLFDAREIFEAACEANLLLIKFGESKKSTCDVYSLKNPTEKIRSFGRDAEGNFISDLENYSGVQTIDGLCHFEWRQGIKHDCSKVMELSNKNHLELFCNGFKEYIDIEGSYVYPLLKSSDLKNVIINKTRKSIIVTQKKIKDETDSIKDNAPKLWNYLEGHSKYLDNRKSSIYKNSPRFSIFGVGDYSFKPFKVAISGFYKVPIFSLVFDPPGKPIMLDDTCYFIGFDQYKQALITMLLLNTDPVLKFIKSIAFLDSKRPYTKEILMRIDLLKVTQIISYANLESILKEKNIQDEISEEDYLAYIRSLQNSNGSW